MNNQPFAWGPLLCKMQVEDSVLNDLLWETKRGDEEYNAEANLVATMHDEWAFAPETIEWFERAITEHVQTYLHTLSYHLQAAVLSPWMVSELWINYQKANDFNPLHDHSSDLSFVLYIQVPKELKTEKERYNMVGKGPDPGSIIFTFGELRYPFVHNQKTFLPERGDLFIFPSTLRHMVMPFKTPDIERISVAGNIRFTE